MRLLLVSVALLGMWAGDVHAQVQQFPYEAVIDADDVDVLSGPGRRYYPTGKLKRGIRVQVRRHDPGAWYMISPPADSFSWIPADAVKRQSDPRIGVLVQNNVSVRIGSTLTDDHEIEQVRLSTGDRVEIIGEGRIQSTAGTISMLKIKPPAGEWRWIAGQFVTPMDPALRNQQDHDPFAVPSQAKSSLQQSEQTAANESKASKDSQAETPSKRDTQIAEQTKLLAPDAAVAQTVRDAETQDAEEAALAALDQQFAEMVDLEPDHWNLDELQQAYVSLQSETASDGLAGQVTLRLQAVERYRSMQAKYMDFIQVTSVTSRREAELAAMMGEGSPRTAGNQQVIQPRPRNVEMLAERFQSGPALPIQTQSGVETADAGEVIHAAAETSAEGWSAARSVERPMPDRPAAIFAQAGPTPQMTGIVQRAPQRHRGAPAHVLLAPDGRLLAYLHAQPGINLDHYVGHPMGLVGQRMHRPELHADLFVVQGLTPLRWTR